MTDIFAINEQALNRVKLLVSRGFKPRTVLDIGAFQATWSRDVSPIFPDSKFFMVEGNKDKISFLKESGFSYEISLLSDKVKTVPFYKFNGEYDSGNSIYKEQTRYFNPETSSIDFVECDTLKNLVERRGLKDIDFIKMDVQGSEKDVIMGGLDIVKKCEVLWLELQVLEYNKGAPMITDMISFLDSIGFRFMDILELHYTNDSSLFQLDALFIRKDSKLIKTGVLF